MNPGDLSWLQAGKGVTVAEAAVAENKDQMVKGISMILETPEYYPLHSPKLTIIPPSGIPIFEEKGV